MDFFFCKLKVFDLTPKQLAESQTTLKSWDELARRRVLINQSQDKNSNHENYENVLAKIKQGKALSHHNGPGIEQRECAAYFRFFIFFFQLWR